MNPMYLVNWLILSVFLTLFTLDVGIAILLLTPFKRQRAPWIRYLIPIWEMEGTFIVFYLVNLQATYPGALAVLAGIYAFPAILAGLFLLLANAFLAYSEFSKTSMERYLKIYSMATIVVAFLFAGILGSALTGVGVNLTRNTGSVLLMLFNPASMAVFIIMALLGVGIVGIMFEVKGIKHWDIAMILGAIALMFCVLGSYTHYLPSGVSSDIIFVALPIFLILCIYIFRAKEHKAAGPLALFWLALSVNLLGILQYPFLFGGQASLLDYLNNSAISGAINLITVVFGTILSIALAYFIYISYIKK